MKRTKSKTSPPKLVQHPRFTFNVDSPGSYSIGVGKMEVNTAGDFFADIMIKVGKDWTNFQQNGYK